MIRLNSTLREYLPRVCVCVCVCVCVSVSTYRECVCVCDHRPINNNMLSIHLSIYGGVVEGGGKRGLGGDGGRNVAAGPERGC